MTLSIADCIATVKRPGKFEGSHPLAVHEFSMEGEGEIIADMEEKGHFAAEFTVTGSEQEEFNWPHSHAILVEDSMGFVYVFTREQYQSWN